MFYTLIKHGFFDQLERAQGFIYIVESGWANENSQIALSNKPVFNNG